MGRAEKGKEREIKGKKHERRGTSSLHRALLCGIAHSNQGSQTEWVLTFWGHNRGQMQLAVPGAILTLCPFTQAYIATKAEMGQQMSPSELSHPVPLSFEPVKNFFKEFVEAIRNTLQTPMDTRLKESEWPKTDSESLLPVWCT